MANRNENKNEAAVEVNTPETASEAAVEASEKKPKTEKIMLPLIRGERNREQFVAVNGKTYLIKRGEEVEVPASVAEVLRHSEAAADEADRYIFANSQS